MAYRIEKDEVDFGHQHIETGMAEPFRTMFDDRVKGGENMSKIYQAVILDKLLGVVTGESYVTAENKNQAFAKVDISEHNVDRIKVFLNKIGEYEPQE